MCPSEAVAAPVGYKEGGKERRTHRIRHVHLLEVNIHIPVQPTRHLSDLAERLHTDKQHMSVSIITEPQVSTHLAPALHRLERPHIVRRDAANHKLAPRLLLPQQPARREHPAALPNLCC